MNRSNGMHHANRPSFLPSSMRIGALAIALASACAAQAATPAATPSKAPDVATDAAGAWTWFLANADAKKANEAYLMLDQMGYEGGKIDTAACKRDAAKLQEAVAAAPISVALHRAAMLCAEANGDNAAAEHEMAAVAALAKLAFSGASESPTSRPIRVFRTYDISALIVTAGLEPQYAYYPYWHMRRYFPLVVNAWDPERKVERPLRFDFIDAAYATLHGDEFQYPYFRSSIVDAVLQSSREVGIAEAIDAMAWKESRVEDTTTRLAKLRLGASTGGVMSAESWILFCSDEQAPAGCADGLVDALLPLAEKKLGWHTMLLAYAYGNGIGVPRDAEAGDRLLDAAQARWAGASSEYVRVWRDAHSHDAPVPAPLLARLARAEAAGDEDARLQRIQMRLQQEPGASLDAKDIAFLSQPSQNGQGEGYAELARWADARKSKDEQVKWRKLAADAGDPDMQADLGFFLAYGADGPKDPKAGRPYLEAAAHGGDSFAARMLAFDADKVHDYATAEAWLTDPAMIKFDTNALLDIAELYEWSRKGVKGKPENAVALYRSLDMPEARRRLASMAMTGRNMPKDVKQARTWIEEDAKQGDHASEAMLGLGLLMGEFGPVDEREGTRWVERAIAGGNKEVSASYGMWLFNKGTPASRAKAVDVWKTGVRNKDDAAANNYAWALCTADVPGFVDGKAGLATANEMGPVDDLPWGFQDTVAACRAAAGDFAGAVALQKHVLDGWRADLAQQEATDATAKQTKKLEARLALYEAGKPYVEAAGDKG